MLARTKNAVTLNLKLLMIMYNTSNNGSWNKAWIEGY